MTLQAFLRPTYVRGVLTFVGSVSALTMIHGGATGRVGQVTAAAAVFASAAAGAALLQCLEGRAEPALSVSGDDRPVIGDAVRDYSLLAAIAYGWGAVAMQGMYLTPLTGLKWQHGWQYAAAMGLLCVVALIISRSHQSSVIKPVTSRSQDAWGGVALLAIGQALIAGGGLASLIVSGKLWSVRADWAANRVFAGLAVAVLAISVGTFATHWRMRSKD